MTNLPPQTNSPAITRNSTTRPTQNLQDGQYPLQQASFDDASGAYTLMLLNTPTGMPSTVQLTDVKMARLTDEQIKAGEKSSVKIENKQPTLYLTEDFKINYTHNVTEVQTNPSTGQRETVIVRRESSFWSPFLGAVAGQAIGSMLFRPQYYVPPVYQSGGGLFGYGGYGRSYRGAVAQYRTRYNRPPAVERNRTKFRSTGQLSNGRLRNTRTATSKRKNTLNQKRSTGSGFGSSTLKRDRRTYKRPTTRRKRSFGFGSSRRSRSGGFGRRGRR
ncbi:hypothetical protein IQ266_06540 [filamentous cyanobacterium LEGE 11480]|uniref:Uncharacterized protein n=2 Tax=Romeriopsis TaxID=2992131 RepID=A0A928Z3L4_9CYAN|nr:hypothetical protein [Romeriopsis navalis LEGE 11480]